MILLLRTGSARQVLSACSGLYCAAKWLDLEYQLLSATRIPSRKHCLPLDIDLTDCGLSQSSIPRIFCRPQGLHHQGVRPHFELP